MFLDARSDLVEGVRISNFWPEFTIARTRYQNLHLMSSTSITFQSNVYKKRCPERVEFVLLGVELLYLWNALPQCPHETLQSMLEELKSCELAVLQPLKQLLIGTIHQVLGNTDIALQVSRTMVQLSQLKI